MRAARRRGVLEVVCCRTRPSRCVLAPLLLKIFFAVVINVAYTRFKVDQDIMDAFVYLLRNRGSEARGGNHRRASPGDVTLRHDLR